MKRLLNQVKNKNWSKSAAIKFVAVILVVAVAVGVVSIIDPHKSAAWPEPYTYSMYPTCEYKPESGLTGYDWACMKGSVEMLVYKYYKVVLNREPDESGFNYWTKGLVGNTSAESQLASSVANEYVSNYANNTISDNDYVKMAFTAILGRSADDGGRTFWVGKLKGGMSRSEFIKQFAASAKAEKPGLTLAQAQSKMQNSVTYVIGSNLVARLIQTSDSPDAVKYMTSWSPSDPNIAYYVEKIQSGSMTYGSVIQYFIHNKGTGNGEFGNFRTFMGANYTPPKSDFTPPSPAKGVTDSSSAHFTCGPPFPPIEPKGNMGGPDYEHNTQCVAAIQWILKYKRGEDVAVNGFYYAKDKNMIAAVKNIQRYYNMPVTGYLTSGQVEYILKALGGDNVDTTTPWTTPRLNLEDMNNCINGDVKACEEYQAETDTSPAVDEMIQQIIDGSTNKASTSDSGSSNSNSSSSGNNSSSGDSKNNSEKDSKDSNQTNNNNSSSSQPPTAFEPIDEDVTLKCLKEGDTKACTDVKNTMQSSTNSDNYVGEYMDQATEAAGGDVNNTDANNNSTDNDASNDSISSEGLQSNITNISQPDFAINYTFIGSGISNSDTVSAQKFDDVVQSTINNLKSLDPFDSYMNAGNFAFNTITTADNLCSSAAGSTIKCDENRISDFIAKNKIPSDSRVFVLTKNAGRGWAELGDSKQGWMGDMATFSLASYDSSDDVSWGVVHEIGHNFGLLDEYQYSSNGLSGKLGSYLDSAFLVPNEPFHQCIAKTPPNNWQDTKGPWSAFPGANIEKWYSGCSIAGLYKSADNSLMNNFEQPGGHTLSPTSSKVLKNNIDYVLSVIKQ